MKNIIIPGEEQEQGWKDFSECLPNIFFREAGGVGRSKQIPLQSGGVYKGFKSSKGEEKKTSFHGNRTWRDVVMETQSAREGTGLATEKTHKMHKLAVVIYRFNLKTTWVRISKALGALLHQRAKVVPLAADTEEREKAFLLKEKWIDKRNLSIAKMENWKSAVHLNYTQIVVSYS